MNVKHTVISIFCIAGITACLQAADISKLILSNKMCLIHTHTTSNDVVAVNLLISGGTREEPDEKAGIAVLAMSLLTRGTRTYTAAELMYEFDIAGVRISASASEDLLHADLLATTSSIDRGFELLADIIINPSFHEEEFEKERDAQLNIIETRDDRITSAAIDILREKLYGHHAYSRIKAGKKETVATITREEVIAWYRQHADPRNAIISVVGKPSLKKITALCERFFSTWKSPLEEKAIVLPVIIPPRTYHISRTKSMNFRQSFIARGYLAPSAVSPDFVTMKLLNEIMGGGMSRRLFQKFREEKPYAYAVGSFYPNRLEQSHFVIYIGLDAKHIDDSKDEMSRMVDDLIKNQVDERELAESKAHLAGKYIIGEETNNAVSYQNAWWELAGRGYQFERQYIDAIQEVTAEDIQKAAHTYLSVPPVSITIQGSP